MQASIIIPSYNRPRQLHDCLEAVCALETDDYEVVVVDDGSAEPLAPVCAPFAPRVRYFRQENSGPAKARNRAVAEARGDFVAFTDDDCRPRPDWLTQLMAAHDGTPGRLVGGQVVNGLPDDRYATASQDLCAFLYDHYGAGRGTTPFFTTNNMGCARAEFLDHGGFDETFHLAAAEDRDFGLRWRESGGTMIFEADAIVDHYHAMSLTKFWRQHRTYGRGAHHLHNTMRARNADLPTVEPLSFYVNLVVWPVRARGLTNLPATALMAMTQVAMISGYFNEARAARRRGG